jgi:glycosyltransferase involved in cell wall biosynthesis
VTKGHLVFITARYNPVPCGVGDYTRPLMAELIKLGWKVTLVTRKQGCPGSLDGVEIHQPVSRWNALNMPLLARELKSLKPDVIHVQYEPFGYRQSYGFAWLISHLKVPTVATVHEVWHANNRHRARDRYVYSHMKRLIVPDSGRGRLLLEIEPAARGRLIEIPAGSTIGGRDDLEESIAPDLNTTRVAYFGFLNRTKKNEVLLEAFKIFASKSKGPVHLEIIGRFTPESDPYHRLLQETCKRLGIESKVTFHGLMAGPDVLKTLARCRFAVLPYIDGVSLRRSSFHVCTAMGLPVITTKPAHNEPLIENGRTAILIDSLNSENLAEQMLELTRDENLRKTLAEGAFAFSKNFSWKKIAAAHDEVYLRLIGRV